LNGYRSDLHAAMHTPVLQQCSDTRRISVHRLDQQSPQKLDI
jgi:hypothetical protein